MPDCSSRLPPVSYTHLPGDQLCNGKPCLNVAAHVKTTKYEHVLPLLASVEESEEIDGLLILLNTVGGVCPFAVKEDVRVYLDESLRRFETVFPACGSSNSAIELTIPELEEYSKFDEWVDVCKLPE